MNNIIIRNTSQAPIYQQIYEQISSQIINGDLKSDEPLPSIRITAKILQVSVITVKKAWEMLEQNGFIYTIKGKGSYVQQNTKKTLEMKRREAVRHIMKDVIDSCKEYDLSKKDFLDIVEKLYVDV